MSTKRPTVEGFQNDKVAAGILGTLNNGETKNLKIAIKLVKERFPNADIYSAIRASFRNIIAIGKKEVGKKQGTPFIALYQGPGAYIKFCSENEKLKKKVSVELGKNSTKILQTIFLLDAFSKEDFANYLDNLSKSKSIREKAAGNKNLPDDYNHPEVYLESVSANFEDEVEKILKKGNVLRPKGRNQPTTTVVSVTRYDRDPHVKAWVLSQAKDKCECCPSSSPAQLFKTSESRNYLEVHHIRPLANQGSDTPENTVALCPACHRQLHHGLPNEVDKLLEYLFKNVSRLNKEDRPQIGYQE
jgi:5-methylcytosine-specific restriction endonuclease McrA